MWRRRLAELSLLTSESVVLFMLAAALAVGAGGRWPSFVAVWAGVLGGFYLVRLLLHFDTGRPALIGAGIVVSALSLLAIGNLQYDPLHAPFALGWVRRLVDDPDAFLSVHWAGVWGVIVIMAGWFRGVIAAQRELNYTRALASYTVGLLAVVALLLFGQGSHASHAINVAAMPYFMLGLLTLSLVHLSRAEYQQGDFLRGPWVLTLGGTVGLLAVLSAIVGLFPLDFFNQLLAPLGLLVLRVLDLIILIIAYPTGLLIIWLIRLITGGRQLELPQVNQVATQGAEQAQQQAQQGGPAEVVVFLAKAVFLLTIVSIIGYLLWRLFRMLRRPLRDEQTDETREAIGEGGLGSDLGALLGAMLGRFRRPTHEREPALPDDILAVRRLYLRALRRAESEGVERPPAATPIEFAPALAQSLDRPAAVALSERFAAARYGLVAPSRETLAALERETG